LAVGSLTCRLRTAQLRQQQAPGGWSLQCSNFGGEVRFRRTANFKISNVDSKASAKVCGFVGIEVKELLQCFFFCAIFSLLYLPSPDEVAP
jgi:hypothetical protein